jgi:ADP-heptose:LPS heptosyltransferase
MNIWFNQFSVLNIINKRPTGKETKGVIVIKLDAIGDFLIWLDSASQYRRIYENQKITLICNNICAQIARRIDLFDEIIEIDIKRFETNRQYKKSIISSFDKLAYNTLLQTAFSRTVDMDILAYNIPANEKIGFIADESRTNLSRNIAFKGIRKKLDLVYDMLIDPGKEGIMELERNANFIKGLGYEFNSSFPVLPKFAVRSDIIPPKPYAVIFPGASSGKKMWPIERYSAVGDYLINELNLDIYLCGSQSESYLYKIFLDNMTNNFAKSRIHDYFGKTTLIELAEVIRNAELLIGNDTSGIHFAAAVNTKGICVFGDFAYGRFLPYVCEKENAGHEPIIVCHAGMECKGCANGKVSKKCKENLLRTGRYLCIDRVNVEKVIGKIIPENFESVEKTDGLIGEDLN